MSNGVLSFMLFTLSDYPSLIHGQGQTRITHPASKLGGSSRRHRGETTTKRIWAYVASWRAYDRGLDRACRLRGGRVSLEAKASCDT
ncbi:hypothetical protein QR685DRAFT_514594 [Neurospora intermedia]|uniref:Questionable protein n=1 Tax=Neurospora intermedia TaxID=5142 RepID=A0ABR3DTY6_NEUIN